MKDLQRQRGLAYLFIAHDLAVVRYLCDHVMVMYRGRIVESAPSEALFTRPRHPYTRALLSAVPDVDRGLEIRRSGRPRDIIAGDAQGGATSGCAFHPRCPLAQARCRAEAPALVGGDGGHAVACHFAD
jgi:peptide/nickel transport system ATP-binding protein